MRSQRRHQAQRVKRARSAYEVAKLVDRSGLTAQQIERHRARVAANPTPCSCWMCGNPRKWLGEATRQERSAAELLRKGEFTAD